MLVCVNVNRFMEIDDPVFQELHDLHEKNADGTPEQYEKAISVIEEATGVKFFDFERDGIENTELRITNVYEADDYVPILEA